jgi:hypothetical protein
MAQPQDEIDFWFQAVVHEHALVSMFGAMVCMNCDFFLLRVWQSRGWYWC